MTSPFYEALFDTRISGERDAASEFETNEGGYRLSTSIGGVLTGRGADIIVIGKTYRCVQASAIAIRAIWIAALWKGFALFRKRHSTLLFATIRRVTRDPLGGGW